MPAPTLIAVVTETPPPGVPATAPAPIDSKGGTILTLETTDVIASELEPYVTVEFLTGPFGSYVVHAEGVIGRPSFDVRLTRVYVGTPPLEPGLYHVRVTTDDGSSAVLEDVVASRVYAERWKVQSVREKWASAWNTGRRRLR